MEKAGIYALAIIMSVAILSFTVLAATGVVKLQPTPASVTQTGPSAGPASNPTNTAATPSQWGQVTSALEIDVNDRDALASTTLTEGTNIQTDYWWSTTGQVPLNFLGAASTSTPFKATFNMSPTYGNAVYIRTQIVSGQNYYITPIVTMQSNACVSGYDYLDVQNTGSQQWVFKCDLTKSGVNPSPTTNAGGSGGSAPVLTYYAFAYAYTKPTMTYNNGGSLKSIGTGANVLNQILYVEKTTTAKAFAIQEVDIAVNNTSATTYINQGQSNIAMPVEASNGAMTYQTMYFSSANINGISDGTNVNWKWYFNAPQDTTFGVPSSQQNNNLKGAFMYFAQNNGNPAQIPFTTNVYTSLTSNLNLLVTEKHVFATPAGGTDSNSQAVTLCAGTNCT